ncbi:MAG: hypothetical protein B6244_07495 [Candidatus Cloacimonetes bacterium 4572_55]|nr:MAG: hypothetical protein B6244_07495 [Candidatus Cloacimonetes bacterium 4572_55]
MDTTTDVVMTGENTYNGFGYSVSRAGDVNGDGGADVVVSAPYHPVNGAAYIYHGQAADEHFTTGLIVSDANSQSDTLVFGTAIGATDGYDSYIDQYASPLPPPGAFATHFENNSDTYAIDIRPPIGDDCLTWTVYFQPSTNGDPITLSWDSTSLPEGSFLLSDTFGGAIVSNVDMKSVNSFEVPNPSLTRLKIVYCTSVCMDKEMLSGWNMIGLPVIPADGSVDSLFPNAIANTLYEFDGSYLSAVALEAGVGYWLRFSAAETVQLCGVPFTTQTLDLSVGWNMIAGPSCTVPLSAVIDPDNIIIENTLYFFDGSYRLATSIEQGEGYWIRANAAGQVTLNCSARAIPSVAQTQTLPHTMSLNFSDNAGIDQILHCAYNPGAVTNVESFSLPPVPMPSAFDIRFSGDTRLTTGEETVIHIQGVDYPLTIRAENVPVDHGVGYVICEMRGDEEISRHPLVEKSDIVISNSEITHLLLSPTTLIPTLFEVEQNYPNPFNPITAIRYAIPRAGDVEIRVYNITGQRIKTLVDDPHEAGYYSVIWDGHNDRGSQVSSGTYFYVVKAGTDEATRKMVLIR